jgi:hypothetical protein
MRGVGGPDLRAAVSSVQMNFQERRKKMKKLMIVLTVLFVFSISAFAQMSTGQGGGMMGGGWGWGWGMNSGWLFVVIIAFLVILGIVYMMKRK